MNKKRVALALAAALGINTLMVTVGQVGGQLTVAHAQNARLTGDQVKLLDGIKIKSLSTAVEISSTGEALISFTDIKKENIKNVKVSEAFKHEVFTERKDIDTPVSTTIDGTWDSSTGKLKLNSKITQPGIYTGKVEIEFTNGTKETYTVSLRKTPSDSVSFIADVKVGTIEISNLVLNNGAGDISNFTPKKVSVSLNSGTEKEVTAASGKYIVSALDLTSNGKLKEGDVLTVKIVYGAGSEYTLSEEVVFVGAEKKEILNAFASNDTTEFAKLATQIDTDFGATGASTGSFVGGTDKYDVTVGGKTLFTYNQTVVSNANNVVVGGAKLIPGVSGDVVDLNLSTATLYSTAATNNFVPYVGLISYGNAGTSTGIIGNYSIQAEGQQARIYFDAVTVDPTLGTSSTIQFVKYDPALSTQVSALGSYGVNVDFDKLGHGYSPINITFSVDASDDSKKVDAINNTISSGTATTKHIASYTEVGSTVSATLIVSTDVLDGVHTQAKFEQTSASEGKITLVGGKSIVGTSTDLNTVKLTVGGATASIIGSESAGNDLVFSVQFNGQVPTSINWSLAVGSTSKVKGTLETGVLESTNIKSVKATNSGTILPRDAE